MFPVENKENDLTFDDVLLKPQYSEVESRKDVDISYDGLLGKLKIPFLSSPMDSISEFELCLAMEKAGGRGIFHRFMSEEQLKYQVDQYLENCLDKSSLILSLGVSEKDLELGFRYHLDKLNCPTICLDVAHAHCKKVISMIKKIKRYNPKTVIIAGTIATKEAVEDLSDAGADILRINIGAGSSCSTRIVAATGIAQLTAAFECSEAAKACSKRLNRRIETILDGGVKNSGDMAKGLVFSDLIMSGSLFSATDETPGEIISRNGILCKVYKGMSSLEANNKIGKKATPEGVLMYKKCKGSISNILEDLSGGLRSALSYSGAFNLKEFKQKAIFRKVSPNVLIENKPHGQENL